MCSVKFHRFLALLLCFLSFLIVVIMPCSYSVKAYEKDIFDYEIVKSFSFDSDFSSFACGHSNCHTGAYVQDSKLYINFYSIDNDSTDVIHRFIPLFDTCYVDDDYVVKFKLRVLDESGFQYGLYPGNGGASVVSYLFHKFCTGFADGNEVLSSIVVEGPQFLRDCRVPETNDTYVVEVLKGDYKKYPDGYSDLSCDSKGLCFAFGCSAGIISDTITYEVSDFALCKRVCTANVDKFGFNNIELTDSVLKTLKIVASCSLGVCAVIFVVSIIPRRKRK